MKNLFYGCLALLFLGPTLLLGQQTGSPNNQNNVKNLFPKLALKGQEVQFSSSALERSFDAYDLFAIDFSTIKASSKENDFFEANITLGDKHQWNLVLMLNDMRAPDYEEIIGTDNGIIKMPRQRATTFKGYINNPGSLGEEIRFNISDDFINGFVKVDGEVYFIEPLKMTDANGPDNYFVVYRENDITADEEHICTAEAIQKHNPFEEGEVEFDLKQSGATCVQVDLVTACTFDYVAAMGGVGPANARITAITNLVQGLYTPFMLEFLIVQQFAPATAAADPFTPSALAEDLLASMRTFAQASMLAHDIGQIWTQRDIFGCGGAGTGLVGCAFVGTVCLNNRYSLIENFTNNFACLRTLSAHEIGHNFNANHDAGGGFIMSTPLNCAATVFSPVATTAIQNHINSRTCLAEIECCELVINCDQLPDQTVNCSTDIPAANPALVTVESACSGFAITVTEQGAGTPGSPLVRTYTVTDGQGNTASCSQTITVLGNSALTTSIWPRTCILADFNVSGTYNTCAPLTATSVILQFWQNGVFTGVSVTATLNTSTGTWSYDGRMQDLIALGLDFGNWYDVRPVINLSNNTSVLGPEFVAGLNNDLYFADQSDPVVVINDDPTDFTTSMTRICEGSPIYYHGTDPLSSNHFSSIKRRPAGSPFPFGTYHEVGWVNASLDGYTGDILAQYQAFPGYFQVGYEYQLKLATSNNAECITWTEVFVEFEIVDCCEPNAVITEVPECINTGQPFTISVTIEAPLTAKDIERIYSSYNNFTYISHEVIETSSSLELVITFEPKTCSCEGEMLVFDIVLVDCPKVIWLMTDEIPCCAPDCRNSKIVDWTADEKCIILNGNPARSFCIEVFSDVPINGVLAGTNNSTCQVNLHDLQITQVSINNVYTICGYMEFTDPTCTGHALVTLVLDTERGCCTIEQAFSFPGGCTIDEECSGVNPDIQLIYVSRGASINVSLNIPTGQTVTVIDHNTGTTQTVAVGTIKCGPFAIDQNGTIFGGSYCNGITFFGPEGIDCNRVEGVVPSIPYFFEIQWGDCTWIITGDYCRETLVYPSTPNDGGSHGRSADVDRSSFDTANGQISVFPNPVDASGLLTFDLTGLTTPVKAIQITDLYGKTIESFTPDQDQQVFQHQLAQPLHQGIYFVQFHLQDGSVSSTRLVAVQ